MNREHVSILCTCYGKTFKALTRVESILHNTFLLCMYVPAYKLEVPPLPNLIQLTGKISCFLML